jgi:proteasome lid subunit RPN8/RPN11
MAEEKWCSGLEIITKCSVTEKAEVYVSRSARDKIDALMDEFKHMEWLGYLVGKIKGTKHYIEDMVIPEQEVTTASVKVLGDPPSDCIGTVHSHHTMGAFTSGTDEEHLVGNHPVCMVVSDSKTIAKVRLDTPCGRLVAVDATVYTEEIEKKPSPFVEDAKTKIKEKTFIVSSPLFSNSMGRDAFDTLDTHNPYF